MSKILIYDSLDTLTWHIKRVSYNNKRDVNDSIFNKTSIKIASDYNDLVSTFDPYYLIKNKTYFGHMYDKKPLHMIEELLQIISPIDRTGYLEYYKTAYDPIPIYNDGFVKSYSDIILDRAKQLWETYDTINVLLNGDAESIAVSLSLIETKPNNKKLEIICLDSLDWNDIPFIKEFVIKKTSKEFFNIENLNPQHPIILSDNLKINVALITYKNSKNIQLNTSSAPWSYLLTSDVGKKLLGKINIVSETKKFNRLLDDHRKQSPFTIQSVNDMLWWLSFVFSKNYTNYKIPFMIIQSIEQIKPRKIDLSKWINFFNTNDWELWHMKNYNSTRNLNVFKKETNRFIKKNIDPNKIQFKSIHQNNTNNKNFFILDDGRIIYLNELTMDVIKEIV